MPRHIAAFRIDRYRVGMAYGNHPDNPLIGDSETLRPDISMTVVPHEAVEITRGVRVAVIGWLQSYRARPGPAPDPRRDEPGAAQAARDRRR